MANTKKDARSSAAADAAVEEVNLSIVDGEAVEADPADDATVVIVVDDKPYSFPRKRMDAIKFRLLMQKGTDAAGIEYLLGPDQFSRWLDASADEDGDTDLAAYERLMVEVGKVFGVGN